MNHGSGRCTSRAPLCIEDRYEVHVADERPRHCGLSGEYICVDLAMGRRVVSREDRPTDSYPAKYVKAEVLQCSAMCLDVAELGFLDITGCGELYGVQQQGGADGAEQTLAGRRPRFWSSAPTSTSLR